MLGDAKENLDLTPQEASDAGRIMTAAPAPSLLDATPDSLDASASSEEPAGIRK